MAEECDGPLRNPNHPINNNQPEECLGEPWELSKLIEAGNEMIMTTTIVMLCIIVPILIFMIVSKFFRARAMNKYLEENPTLEAEEEIIAENTTPTALESWQHYLDKEKKVMARFLEAETSWDMLFNYPALTDPDVETTSAMYKAMKIVQRMDSEPPTGIDADTDVSRLDYPRAVIAFEHAFDDALEYAQRVGQRSIPPAERKILSDIEDFLAKAQNAASSETERELAKSRIRSLVKQLDYVKLPQKTIAAIESDTMSQLTMLSAKTPV